MTILDLYVLVDLLNQKFNGSAETIICKVNKHGIGIEFENADWCLVLWKEHLADITPEEILNDVFKTAIENMQPFSKELH